MPRLTIAFSKHGFCIYPVFYHKIIIFRITGEKVAGICKYNLSVFQAQSLLSSDYNPDEPIALLIASRITFVSYLFTETEKADYRENLY